MEGAARLNVIRRNYCCWPRPIVNDVTICRPAAAWESRQTKQIVAWQYPAPLPPVMTTKRDVRNLPDPIDARSARCQNWRKAWQLFKKVVQVKIGIVGDGIAGRTIKRLLSSAGMPVDLFGQPKRTRCGVRPCGFGTSAAFIAAVSRLGIPPERYVLGRDAGITIDGRAIAGDLYSIDKPRLLEALSSEVLTDAPCRADYDLLVDATGVRRELAPPIKGGADKQAAGYQYRAEFDTRPVPAFDPIKGGYLWTIPLRAHDAHVGGASTILPDKEVEARALARLHALQPVKMTCSCSERFRLSGPLFPLVVGNVVTVGESAGLVVPFGAAGIHTAFESAVILARYLPDGDLAGYQAAIRRRFGRLTRARRTVDAVEQGRFPLAGFAIAWWSLRYQGLRPTVSDLMHVRRALLAANRMADR
jgi:hypothetical protein